MTPSNEEIAGKYAKKVEQLKVRLKEIQALKSNLPGRKMYLSDLEMDMIKKGIKHSQVDMENELRQCYVRIGRLHLKVIK